MEKIFNSIVKGLSRYEILNNLIPGALLCYILGLLGYYHVEGNVIVHFFAFYIVGVINSRVSSLVIEEIYKKIRIIKWKPYSSYNKAKQSRPFIATLQETANMYRSFTSVFFISLLAVLYKEVCEKYTWLDNNGYWIVLILIFVIYTLSYRKQVNKYVIKNIEEVENEQVALGDKE